MGIVNLLKANYVQKLGETYGAKWKNKNVIRAVPFSKAPPTLPQTKSVRAFECLNRLSSALAKVGFSYLGLSSKGLHKHNAVARFLKPAVSGHEFNPANIKQVITPSGPLSLRFFVYNRSSGVCSAALDCDPSFVPSADERIFTLVFSSTGTTFFAYVWNHFQISFTINIPYQRGQVLYFMAFMSSARTSGRYLNNFIFRERSGMRYSLEEQLTGDFWLDGKPIYRRTIKITIPTNLSSNWQTINTLIPGVDTFIRSEPIFSRRVNQNILMTDNFGLYIDNPSNKRVVYTTTFYQKSTSEFCIGFYVENQTDIENMQGNDYYSTVFYTKTADMPIVDG